MAPVDREAEGPDATGASFIRRGPTALKAAAYIRAPHETPDDRERQVETIRRFVESFGWELGGVYAEPSGSRRDRPSLRRLLAAAEQRMVDVIVIERLDRVADSLRELVQVFEAVGRCRVALVCLEEQIDTSRDGGNLIFHVMRAVDQFERRLHGQRIRVGLARARVLGTRVGRPPTGVDPATVGQLREEGLSYRQIGRRLGISPTLAHRLARRSPPGGPGAVQKPLHQIL